MLTNGIFRTKWQNKPQDHGARTYINVTMFPPKPTPYLDDDETMESSSKKMEDDPSFRIKVIEYQIEKKIYREKVERAKRAEKAKRAQWMRDQINDVNEPSRRTINI